MRKQFANFVTKSCNLLNAVCKITYLCKKILFIPARQSKKTKNDSKNRRFLHMSKKSSTFAAAKV